MTWNGLVCEHCGETREYPFSDVPANEFYAEAALWALDNGITNGTGDGTTFSPNGALQRAQVVTMLWRAAGEPIVEVENPFSDVTAADFFYNAVLWAYAEGITTGLTADHFGPYATTNRAQAVTFLWRAKGEPESTAVHSFEDVVAGEWYEAAINWAVENNVTNGISAKEFGINQNCNRAHMVTFLYRAK